MKLKVLFIVILGILVTSCGDQTSPSIDIASHNIETFRASYQNWQVTTSGDETRTTEEMKEELESALADVLEAPIEAYERHPDILKALQSVEVVPLQEDGTLPDGAIRVGNFAYDFESLAPLFHELVPEYVALSSGIALQGSATTTIRGSVTPQRSGVDVVMKLQSKNDCWVSWTSHTVRTTTSSTGAYSLKKKTSNFWCFERQRNIRVAAQDVYNGELQTSAWRYVANNNDSAVTHSNINLALAASSLITPADVDIEGITFAANDYKVSLGVTNYQSFEAHEDVVDGRVDYSINLQNFTGTNHRSNVEVIPPPGQIFPISSNNREVISLRLKDLFEHSPGKYDFDIRLQRELVKPTGERIPLIGDIVRVFYTIPEIVDYSASRSYIDAVRRIGIDNLDGSIIESIDICNDGNASGHSVELSLHGFDVIGGMLLEFDPPMIEFGGGTRENPKYATVNPGSCETARLFLPTPHATPTENLHYSASLQVNAPSFYTSVPVNIYIEYNDAPKANISVPSPFWGKTSYRVSWSANDPNGDNLSCTVKKGGSYISSRCNGSKTYTVNSNINPGSHTFTITASDGVASDSDTEVMKVWATGGH